MPNKFLDLLIIISATWWIARIITQERIGRPIRRLFGASLDSAGMESFPDTFFAYLTNCIRCMSMWTAVLVVIVWQIEPLVVLPFAAAGGAVLLNKYS